MPENIMVTLRFNGDEADFELPSGVPLSSLEEPLKRALGLKFPGAAVSGKQVLLRNDRGYLLPDRSLSEYCVYDGAVLDLELIERR